MKKISIVLFFLNIFIVRSAEMRQGRLPFKVVVGFKENVDRFEFCESLNYMVFYVKDHSEDTLARKKIKLNGMQKLNLNVLLAGLEHITTYYALTGMFIFEFEHKVRSSLDERFFCIDQWVSHSAAQALWLKKENYGFNEPGVLSIFLQKLS